MRTYTRTVWLEIADRLSEISAQLDTVKSRAILGGGGLLFDCINIAALQASLAADLAVNNAQKGPEQ